MNFPAPSPYTPTPDRPNSACFLNPDTATLTLSLASRYFFLKSGDTCAFINSSLYQLDGSIIQAQYLTGITLGTASPSKSLVLNSDKDISGIRNLAATKISLSNTSPNSLAIQSSSTNVLTNASFTGEYDLYIKRNLTTLGTTSGISFLHTSNDATNTLPSASIITTRVALSSADMTFNTTNVERMKISSSGLISFTNTTDSSSSTLGSVLLSGGLSINESADASSSTNGGSITTAGGVAIAKKLYVGTDLNISGISSNLSLTGTNSSINLTGGSSILTLSNTSSSTNSTTGAIQCSGGAYFGGNSIMDANLSIGGNLTITGSTTGIVNATITDTGIATLVNPLTITHSLSSGTPTAGSFRMGMLFQGPNSSLSNISYGRIYATCQLSTAGAHQGSITLSSVFAGDFVDVMTISSLTSSTNNLVSIAGATSILSVYNISATIGTFSSNLTISKAAAPSLTIASTTTSSQSQLIFTTDNQTWEIGARGSTATLNPTNFYIYNTQMNMVMSPAGITQFLNSAVSTTSSSNSFQIEGGLYIAKAILNNSYYNCNTINVPSSHSVSSQSICLNSHAIYFRGQNNIDSNHGLMYSGKGNPSWNSNNGFGNSSTFNVDGPVLYGNKGVMIGNMTGSNETICATFDGTTTNLLGTTNINSPPVTPSRANIQSFGSQLGLINNTNGYVTLSSLSSGTFNLTCHNPSNPSSIYWFNYYFDSPSNFASQSTKPRLSLSGSPSPADTGDNFRLHLGSTAGDIQIVLFNQNNLSSSYGFGANNSSIQYISAGVNGHKFYYSSMTGIGAPTNLGNLLGTIDHNGNIIAQSGLRATGYNPNYLGKGSEIHFAADIASFFGYDRTALSFTDMSMGNNNIFIKSSNGYVGINTTSPIAPLHVNGSSNLTNSGNFGWVNSGGGGNSTGFTNRPFSLYTSSGILVGSGELDVLSDEYFKNNIKEIDDKLAIDFITKIKPISFSYKNANKNFHYGYSAQELVKNKFNVLVGATLSDEPLAERELINDEGEKLTIPKDTRLIVNLLATIPLLHRALQLSNERIKKNEETINELKKLLSKYIRRIY